MKVYGETCDQTLVSAWINVHVKDKITLKFNFLTTAAFLNLLLTVLLEISPK